LSLTTIISGFTFFSADAGGPIIVPNAAGTLNVTWESLAPDTNTFQGDMNLTMLWLSFEARGANITLESIKADTWGIPSQGINRTFIWDDRNDNKQMNFFECVVAEDASSPYVLPPSGQMVECAGAIGQPIVIYRNQTRSFIILMDLDFDPIQRFTDRDLRLCVGSGGVTSTANDTYPSTFSACSSTIDVNRRFFYDGMEKGQGEWTFTGGDEAGMHPDGLWHLSENENNCTNTVGIPFSHQGNTSWWYGRKFEFSGNYNCNYFTHEPGNVNNETRNWGRLRTPWIDARQGSSLAMNLFHLLAREQWPTVDLAQVYLFDGLAWHFISNEIGTNSTWKKLLLNLSAYSGQQIQLEFRFDTMDEMNNQYPGWFIDDFVVFGEIMTHDIAVTELNLGDYASNDPQTVVARVSNIGSSGESNIEANLTEDGAMVDQTTISSLASGDNTTVNLAWTPPGEGVYEMCVETKPVAGEIVLWNNIQCHTVNVTAQNFTKIVVLRSWGTQAQASMDTWDDLNLNWGMYGQSPIQIDYTTLNTYPITYDAINGTEADVLVLSGSGYYGTPPVGTELDDSENVAVEQWVREGHGFVSIGTVLNQEIPNNNDLVDLVGVVNQPYDRDFADDIQVESGCVGHPLFNNVPDLFQTGFGHTMSPNDDHSWNSMDLDGGQMCARSPGNNSAAIVVFKGSVMISFAGDTVPTRDENQLLYNAFVWSRFNASSYDVRVSEVKAPRFIRPLYPANISSVVSNLGREDLFNVDVILEVDGSPVDTMNLADLSHGNWTYVNFTWFPATVGTYQICVFADIIGFVDDDPSNNRDCTSTNVTTSPPVQVYVLDSWGTDFASQAPWDYLNANWASLGGVPIYIDYDRFNKENILYQELADSYADVLLISSSRWGISVDPIGAGYHFTSDEMNAIAQYTQDGHGIIATGLTLDTELLPAHGLGLGSLFGLNPANSYTYATGIHNLHIINPIENHPLFHNISANYTSGGGMTLSPGSSFTGPENWTWTHLTGGEYKALTDPDEHGAVIAHETPDYNAVYITNFVEENSNGDDLQLLYNAMTWGRSSVTPPTDLWIYKSGNTLRLEWLESASPRVQGYRIYRATSVNGFNFGSVYAEVPIGSTQWLDPQADAGIDVSNYFYLVRAFDEKGNEDQNLMKVGKFVQQLNKGTNEISIGFELKDKTTSVAFESVDGAYRSIEAYDPYTCTWKSW
jgi:hypothetical protein